MTNVEISTANRRRRNRHFGYTTAKSEMTNVLTVANNARRKIKNGHLVVCPYPRGARADYWKSLVQYYS